MNTDKTNPPSEEQVETPPAKRSPAAERMRAYRKRRREGMRCVTLDLREREIDRLVEFGYLRQDDREDPNEVLLAMYPFLDRSALGG